MNKKTVNKITKAVSVLLIVIVILNVPNILFAIGKKHLENKEYVEGYHTLKKALFFKPNNENFRYYYVKSMSGLKPTLQIQKAMFKYSQDKKKDLAQKFAERQVDLWRDNISEKIGENFIEQAPFDKNIIRWSLASFPLKVSIDVPENTPDYYYSEIEKAFWQWSNKVDFLNFEFTDEKTADIYIKFEPLPDNICEDGVCKYVVAYTEPKISNRTLKSMTITMYDRDANGNYFSDKELYNTILHEIGHALGIMGHSYSSDDLMYLSASQDAEALTRYRRDMQYLSAHDINTIKLLYKMFPDISNVPHSKLNKSGQIYAPVVLGTAKDIGRRKIKEALVYIENAPNLPGGYIDLAVAYADMGKNSLAIDALRKALEKTTTTNDRHIIYYNISAIYLNSNKLEEAQLYLDLAKELNDSADISELQSNINHAKAAKKKPFKTPILEE